MSRLHFFLAFCALFAIFAMLQGCGNKAVVLQPHIAVYNLSLTAGRGRNSISSATGKLSYGFDGNRCEGYSTKSRFTTALQSQDGTTTVTDMTSASFESGDGKEMHFVTISKSNGKLTDAADGVARIEDDGTLKVTVNEPKKNNLTFDAGLLFPAQHSLKLLDTARSGEPVFRADLFDGSESGKKAYATTGIIGKNVHGEIPADDPAAKLAKLPRYKISLSFFDSAADYTGEQIALYDISSVMFDNGVTYSMVMNYPEFSIEAKLESLELLPVRECK